LDQQGIRRGGGFKADRSQDNGLVWLSPADLQCIQRRIDHPDLAAPGYGLAQAATATGHPDQVAEAQDQMAGLQSQVAQLINIGRWCHTDRTAWTGNQPDLRRQQ